jgi:hypothetical protein
VSFLKANYILLLQNQILSMHVSEATIQYYEKKCFKNPEVFPDFWEFVFQKIARFFEQYFNFALFYQNLIKFIFFKNSKGNWLRKV